MIKLNLFFIKFIITKSYLKTFKFFHIQIDKSIIVFKNEYLDLIIRNEKWIYEKEIKVIWYFIISNIFFQMIHEIIDDKKEINVKIILYMSFVIFLWYEEFI